MVSTNEKINISGITLTGISLFPFILPLKIDVVTGAIFTLIFSFIGSTLFMNKGSKWIVNILAQKEPLIFSIGTTLAILGIRMMTIYNPGNSLTTTQAGIIVGSTILGIILATTSIIARYTELLDI